jgi:hypothetical protein
MAKTCIICGGRAGSGEHVFPAVLGGRRINNGIYCDTHNQGFSPLASIIGWQLKAMNALLAVRPDHKKKAEPFKYTSPSGEELAIFNGSVTRSQPAATDTDAPMQIELKLGGDDGLKAVAYIGLTFFAAYFQDQARKPGLQPLKDFLLGTGQNEFVWWELEKPHPGVPANPFLFGHKIVLVTSAAAGTATAYVSFFDALNFGMTLGAIDGLSDRTVVVFIDPLADGPPQDLQKHEHNTVLVEVQKPEPLHTYLRKVIADGVGQRAFQGFLERVEEWKFTKDMAPVLTELNAARSLPLGACPQEITRIVDGQLSRIYRIMRYIADNFAATQKAPVAGKIIPVLSAMVKIEDAPKPAFGPDGQHVFLESRKAIIGELEKRLSQSDADMDFLYRLLSGNIGAGIVCKIMFARADAVLFGGS